MAKYQVTLTRSHFYTIEVEGADQSEAENAAWDILHSKGLRSFISDDSMWEDTAYVEEVE